MLDPDLKALKQSQGQLTKAQEAVAIASIIEMGLVNSSHVLAVMTANTMGSQWVPYEYGRVKESPPVSLQAASWVEPALTSFPEYLYLGPVTNSESDVLGWLQSEFQRWGPCGGVPAQPWQGAIPPPL